MDYEKMYKLALEYSNKLRADDPRFNNNVDIWCEDGSRFSIRNSFLLHYNNWLMVFSEHYGIMVFDVDDLLDYRQYGATCIIKKFSEHKCKTK